MITNTNISQALSHLNPELISEILTSAITKEIPEKNTILREGQYVKVIPIVMSGLIKVFTRHKDKELLLYYIRPNDSCIMSFAAGLKNEPSKVFAITEQDTSALLLPVDKVSIWTRQFPDINALFFQQYNLRYSELLDTIHQVLFDKMDKRLFDYLQKKMTLTNKNPLKISHRQIANELGTAREVVSRTIKKLETEKLVKQHSNNIEIL
jgi:CRP/FNR family transcriptional regulator